MPQKVDIAILVDNTAQRLDLAVEHGLAFWAQAGGAHILFDSGQGAALEPNAAALDIDLNQVDTVVLSHGHYDHTGGLETLFRRGLQPRIFMHPNAMRMRYGCLQTPPHKPIGMPARIAAAISGAQHIVQTAKPARITPHVWSTGLIPRRTSFEDTGGRFYTDPECTVKDEIPDDQALWTECAAGLVVLLGCAHSGLVNTLDYISALSGGIPIHAVIGGMHLLNASEERLTATLDALQRYNIQVLAPCHCTGEAPAALLAQRFPEQFAHVGAGSRFVFD